MKFQDFGQPQTIGIQNYEIKTIKRRKLGEVFPFPSKNPQEPMPCRKYLMAKNLTLQHRNRASIGPRQEHDTGDKKNKTTVHFKT